MQNLHKKYITETYDENGRLAHVEWHIPDSYNFAFDIVDEMARLDPDKIALLWTSDKGEERRFSFAELKRLSDKTANMFRAHGIGKGDMVMLVLKRHYQFWLCMLALNKLGAVAVPGTNLLTKKDFVYRFNAADIKAIVCTTDGETADHVDDAVPESPTLKMRFSVHGDRPGWMNFDREMEAASEDFPRPTGADATVKTDPMLMYFTSGTTGMPKMVIHNQCYSMAHLMTAKHWQNVSPEGLHLTLSDTGWGKAVWGKLYGQWIMETCVFVYDFDKFTPSDLLAIMEKYRITTFCAPPTMFRFFIKEGMEGYDLSSLQYTAIAGEALNPEVYNRFLEYTGIKLAEGFGQTETTCIIFNQKGDLIKPGSMGRPSPAYRVAVVREDGTEADVGEVGEICVRTDEAGGGVPIGLFMGYYRDEERTRQVWHDGLYHTGDTAWRDEDGYFWYVGRVDDVIKSSGYRIGPFEIESVLMEHPAVLECAITGAPDPVRGQVVKATIVLTRDYQPSEELKKELQNYVKKQTAPYKYPRVVEFVAELPKTISGKIRRAQIREESK